MNDRTARRTLCTLLLGGALCIAGLAGCGQRGPLYVPERNARVVTRPAASASSAPADASSPAPASSAPN